VKNTLLETNPYLKDAAKRTIALTRNIEKRGICDFDEYILQRAPSRHNLSNIS